MSDEGNNRSTMFLSDEEVFDDESIKYSAATNDPLIGIQGESSEQDLAATNEALQEMLEQCYDEINAATQDTEALVSKMEGLEMTISELRHVEQELESSLQLLSEEQDANLENGRRVVELERENRNLRQVNEVIAAQIDTLLETQECSDYMGAEALQPADSMEYQNLIVNAESALSACPVLQVDQEKMDFREWKERMKATIVALAEYHRKRTQ